MIDMTIREDSGELLVYIHKCKTEGNEMPSSEQLLNETGWNKNRLYNAAQHLIESGFVDGRIIKGIGSTKVQDVTINDITTLGINIIENQSEFKQNFGFTGSETNPNMKDDMPKYDYFIAHKFTEQEKDDLRAAIENAFEGNKLNPYYADNEVRDSGIHILEDIPKVKKESGKIILYGI